MLHHAAIMLPSYNIFVVMATLGSLGIYHPQAFRTFKDALPNAFELILFFEIITI